MKFNCDYLIDRKKEKDLRERQWHNYFALIPRRVGPKDCRWLETIEARKVPWDTIGCIVIWDWEYRAKA